jgi:NAD(P)-dependent dehydrogenase (short-subunit alcohol dehydrogenase family)
LLQQKPFSPAKSSPPKNKNPSPHQRHPRATITIGGNHKTNHPNSLPRKCDCASKQRRAVITKAAKLEIFDAISVTTVYPGNISTPIHRDAVEFGVKVSLPEERMEDAVQALLRAALAEPAVCDITTTRTGLLASSLSRDLRRRAAARARDRRDSREGLAR